MNREELDRLIEQDWASEWEALKEAPDLIARPKTAQITLRLAPSVVGRVKRLARARSLPYHALARSWIAEGALDPTSLQAVVGADERQSEQLNLKVDHTLLDALKSRAHQERVAYHRLARNWIEGGLERDEASLDVSKSLRGAPAIKDLLVLVLHAGEASGQKAVRGITRLQKLLFVVEQKLALDSRFYAYNFGPFNEEVNDAVEALKLAGFLKGSSHAAANAPSYDEMMTLVLQRSGPRQGRPPEEFSLSKRGHEAAEHLRRSSEAYEQLFHYVSAVREEWDTPDLVERVYESWPAYAEQSLIREEVARRRRRRSSE
jgi:predicted DNA binding CopG/RHH family protein